MLKQSKCAQCNLNPNFARAHETSDPQQYINPDKDQIAEAIEAHEHYFR